MDASITPAALRQSLSSSQPPLVIDVRKAERFREAPDLSMVMYDALYAWCKEGKDEEHTWNPALYR